MSLIKKLRRHLRFTWQKITRGFSDDETWSLDYSLCKWLLPRLKRFQELNRKHIGKQMLEDGDWHDIVDKMIEGVDFVANYSDYLMKLSTEEYIVKRKEAEKSLELLGRYMQKLWW